MIARQQRLRERQELEARSSPEAGLDGGGWAPHPVSLHRPAWAQRCQSPRPAWEGRACSYLLPQARAPGWLETRGPACHPRFPDMLRAPELLASGVLAGKRPVAGSHAPGSLLPGLRRCRRSPLCFRGQHTLGAVPTPPPGWPGHCTSLCPPPASLCHTRTPRLFWDRPGNAGEPACRRA